MLSFWSFLFCIQLFSLGFFPKIYILGEKFADLSQKYCGTCNRNSMEIKPQMAKPKPKKKLTPLNLNHGIAGASLWVIRGRPYDLTCKKLGPQSSETFSLRGFLKVLIHLFRNRRSQLNKDLAHLIHSQLTSWRKLSWYSKFNAEIWNKRVS